MKLSNRKSFAQMEVMRRILSLTGYRLLRTLSRFQFWKVLKGHQERRGPEVCDIHLAKNAK